MRRVGGQHPHADLGGRGRGGGGAADPRAAAAAGLRQARRRGVRQLVAGRGGAQRAGLEDGARQLRGLRRPLHARQPLPARLQDRHRPGPRLRRLPQARRQRQGGLGLRHRRDNALQPPLLRQARLRGYTVQRNELQCVREGGERAGAAGDEAVVQQADLGRCQAGVPHRPDRGPEGHHRHQPPPPGHLRVDEPAAEAARVQGLRGDLQVRREAEAAGRWVCHHWQYWRPVERHSWRARGCPNLQAPRPHVLHRLVRLQLWPGRH